MKIGILFSDNDFHLTVNAFLSTIELGERQINNYNRIPMEERYTKERIVELFNRCADSIYWMCQNGFTYEMRPFKLNNYKDYLKIEERHVFINSEVDEKKYQDNDGCFHFIEI